MAPLIERYIGMGDGEGGSGSHSIVKWLLVSALHLFFNPHQSIHPSILAYRMCLQNFPPLMSVKTGRVQ